MQVKPHDSEKQTLAAPVASVLPSGLAGFTVAGAASLKGNMIAKITRIYTRSYSDNGQVKTYVEWLDEAGQSGRTEGNRANAHMDALIRRGKREGVIQTFEKW